MKPLKISIVSLFLPVMAVLLLNSCSKEDDYAERDDQSIREYLDKKGLTAEKTGSGLYYIITVPGNSLKPDLSSMVTVHYKGYFLNDEVFESSYSGSAPRFPLSGVIKGWQEGLQLFGKGGKGTLFIPSRMAYGNSVVSGVPSNSVLIFDIHLINIE